MDFNKDIEKLNQNFKQNRQKSRNESLREQQAKNDAESKTVEDRYFDLLKNATILSGTIFASTIALSTGKSVNCFFILGEFLLLFATSIGVLFLWSQLKSAEWTHFFNIKGQLQGDMIVNKDIMYDFEKETIEGLIKSYDQLLNKKGMSYHILKIVKVDWLPSIFFSALFFGLLFIWASLLV